MKLDPSETTQPPETLAAIAARCGVTSVTVWRWVTTGVAVGGHVVKLAARRVGGRWVVSREAWEQFDRELNPQQPTLPESPAAERRRAERESEELARRLGSTEEEIREMRARRRHQ